MSSRASRLPLKGLCKPDWVCVNLSKVMLALCKQAPLSSEQHAAQVDRMLRAIPTPRLPPRLTASTSLMGIRNRTRARKQAKIGATSAGVTAFMARQSDCPHTQPFAEVSLPAQKRWIDTKFDSKTCGLSTIRLKRPVCHGR